MELTAEQIQWLADDNEKIVLCDIEYHDGFSLKLAHFSNSPYITPYNETFSWTYSDGTVDNTLNNVAYIDNMSNIPNISSRIDSDVNVGTIEFLNAEGEYDYLIKYAWEGHPLKLFIGSPDWNRNDFIEILTGIATNITSPRPNIIGLGVRDKKEIFNQKLQTKKIYYNSEFDNHLLDLYNAPILNGSPPFTAKLTNIISYSTGIPIYISTGVDAYKLAKLTHDAIVAQPEFVSYGTAPDGITHLTFYIETTIYGAVELSHSYTGYITTNYTFTDTQTGDNSHTQIVQITIDSGIVASSLNSEYFGIYSPYRNFYVWYNYESSGIDPEKIETGLYTQDFNNGSGGIPLTWIPEGTRNAVVPDVLGKVFNIEPVLIDAYNHVYQVSDVPITDITAVRSNGVPLVRYDLASEDQNAQYEVCEEIGCFRLLVHDNNTQITCDVIGTEEALVDSNGDELTPGGAGEDGAYNIEKHSAAYLVAWIALNRAGLLKSDICYKTFSYNGVLGMSNTDSLGIYVREESDIAPIITDIMSSIGGFARFGRVCVLQLFQIVDPELVDDGDIELNITEDDVQEKGIFLSLTEAPSSSITLGYRKNWTVQDPGTLAGLIADPSRDYLNELTTYTNEFSKVYAENINIKDQYPLAEDSDIIPTFIWDESAAIAETNRRINLRNKKRFVYRIQSTTAPFVISVGSKIKITHRRYGFNYTRKALVIGLDEQPVNKKVDIEVWL
jgi:hypothetical protein